jgi:hypothetical protein
MKKIILSFFTGTILFTTATAYPISPRPLRKLIMESEFIIVAHVADLREQKNKKKDYWEDYIAELHIKEVVQGKIKDTIIQVPYTPGMICPAPPRFEKNTNVLVFLNKRDKRFFVHALSYGVKTLNLEEIEIYKMRIKEMQQILTLEDIDEQFIQSTDWLVKCAEYPATRHEGIYELSPESDFMSFYDQGKNQPFQFALNEDQKARLKKALFATSSLCYSDLGLIDLIYPQRPEEVYALLVQSFRNISEDDYWMAPEFMKRMMFYNSSARLQELASDFESKVYGSTSDQTDLKGIMDAFVAEIDKQQ